MTKDVERLRELVVSFRQEGPRSLEEERAAMEAFPQPVPSDITVSGVDADGVRGEWLRMSDAEDAPTLLNFHGGGYRTGSARSTRALMATMTRACGAQTLSIDYRLAPEHPCPAAIEDAVAAYRWLLARGTPASSIVVTGGSAGGGLALALLLALRRMGEALPAGGVLLAPWVDLTLSGDSIESRRDEDFILTAESLRESADQYRGDRAAGDPLVSPLFDDLRGLPPLLIQVGDHDLLRDDSVRLAERAETAGVPVELQVWSDMPHVFQGFGALLPQAEDAIRHLGSWTRTLLGIASPESGDG